MDLQEKFAALKERAETLSDKRIRAEEKLKAAKERVTKAIQASKDAGYPDPRKLGEIKAEKEAELKTKIEELEKAVAAQESILAQIQA
jgi:hypothetical protein